MRLGLLLRIHILLGMLVSGAQAALSPLGTHVALQRCLLPSETSNLGRICPPAPASARGKADYKGLFDSGRNGDGEQSLCTCCTNVDDALCFSCLLSGPSFKKTTRAIASARIRRNNKKDTVKGGSLGVS